MGNIRNVGLRILSLLILVSATSGCSTFGPLDQRGETINRSENDYANDAILLNLVRAQNSEPLQFVTITGVDTTQSATGSLGATFTVGPVAPNTVRDATIGPNSVSRTNSNTAHASVVDDPASFVALMTPVNPAVIAFLERQGFPREFLFFLLTSEIRKVAEVDGRQMVRPFVNDPTNAAEFAAFGSVMSTLLNEGLTAQVDATSVPSGKSLPASRLCIDTAANPPSFGTAQDIVPDAKPVIDLCNDIPWIEADVAQSSGAGGAADKGGSSPTSLGTTRDGSLWLSSSDENKLLFVTPKGQVRSVALPKPATPSKPKMPAHLEAFGVKDKEGNTYQIYLRSTLAAYYYAAITPAHPVTNLLPKDPSGVGSILNIHRSWDVPCFAKVSYLGVDYCVPRTANNTKTLFQILHLLQQIETSPSNTPNTLTVTTIH